MQPGLSIAAKTRMLLGAAFTMFKDLKDYICS
jgi:hypothetical protein